MERDELTEVIVNLEKKITAYEVQTQRLLKKSFWNTVSHLIIILSVTGASIGISLSRSSYMDQILERLDILINIAYEQLDIFIQILELCY